MHADITERYWSFEGMIGNPRKLIIAGYDCQNTERIDAELECELWVDC